MSLENVLYICFSCLTRKFVLFWKSKPEPRPHSVALLLAQLREGVTAENLNRLLTASPCSGIHSLLEVNLPVKVLPGPAAYLHSLAEDPEPSS